jgi:hypothetical protein
MTCTSNTDGHGENSHAMLPEKMNVVLVRITPVYHSVKH